MTMREVVPRERNPENGTPPGELKVVAEVQERLGRDRFELGFARCTRSLTAEDDIKMHFVWYCSYFIDVHVHCIRIKTKTRLDDESIWCGYRARHASPYNALVAHSDARRSHRPTVEKALATCSFQRDCNMVVNGRSTMRADAGTGPGVVAGASTSRPERRCRLSRESWSVDM